MAVKAAAEAAVAVLDRLEALSCPSVTPLPPAEALQLLCTPSAVRLALLEWVCTRVYPPLSSRLAELQDGPREKQVQELVQLGANLMLCRADDATLVEGTAPPEQQLQFLHDLLDAIPLSQESSCDTSENNQVQQLLYQVLETDQGIEILTPQDSPLPSSDGSNSTPWPSSLTLQAALEDTWRQLELLEAQNPELGASPVAALLPVLEVAGADLGALATAFGASELWDSRGEPQETHPPPHLCGALTPHICQGLWRLLQNLETMTQVADTGEVVTQLGKSPRLRAIESQVTALRQHYSTPHSP